MGYSLVVLGFHLPSDVLGGYLVAATFTLIGAAALMVAELRWPAAASSPSPAPGAVAPPAILSAPWLAILTLAAAAVAAVALAALAPRTMVDVVESPVAVLAGMGIALLGLTLTTGLARLLRR